MKKTLLFFLWLAGGAGVLFGAAEARSGAPGTLRLDKAAFMIDSRGKMKVNARGCDAGNLTWTSSDESVAAVSRNGVVTGVSAGDAVITATTPEGATARCVASVDYRGQNPLFPPTWGLFIADGEPHVLDGKMWLFGSRDVVDGFLPNGQRDWCSTDYHAVYSEDLVHWVDAGVIITIDDIPADLRRGVGRLWAPDLFKSPTEKDKYYLTFCGNGKPLFIAESSAPEGPFGNVRLITCDGKPITEIDPGTLVDDDGKVYIATPKFHIGRLDPDDYSRILPDTYRSVLDSMPVDNEPFEGPSLRKRDGMYYYIYIQNKGNIRRDGAVPTLMGYMTSENPLGPYAYRGVVVSNYDYPGSGNIHGSIEKFRGRWYVAYHMPVPGLSLTRQPHMDCLEFDRDGGIRPVIPTSSGVRGAFGAGEKIRSSSGIVYSGGRTDRRAETRRAPTDNPYVFRFTDYPYTFYDEAGQWIGYRYLDFPAKLSRVDLSVCTQSGGGVLEIRRGSPSGEIVSRIPLPDTRGGWRTVASAASSGRKGRDAFYIVLSEAPQHGDVKVDWLSFIR